MSTPIQFVLLFICLKYIFINLYSFSFVTSVISDFFLNYLIRNEMVMLSCLTPFGCSYSIKRKKERNTERHGDGDGENL